MFKALKIWEFILSALATTAKSLALATPVLFVVVYLAAFLQKDGPADDIEIGLLLVVLWQWLWHEADTRFPRLKFKLIAIAHVAGWAANVFAIATLWRLSDHSVTSLVSVALITSCVVALPNWFDGAKVGRRRHDARVAEYSLMSLVCCFIWTQTGGGLAAICAFVVFGLGARQLFPFGWIWWALRYQPDL
ncbi:MAG: hypothetical protein ABSA66_13405 [Roseiarcus sp.]